MNDTASEPVEIERIPTEYIPQYVRVRSHDPENIDNYIRHTTLGDPELDPVLDELDATLPPEDMHRYIRAGVEKNEELLRKAPQVLQDFFKNLEVPSWVDFNDFKPACSAFQVNTEYALVAFALATLIEGFGTMIARSFRLTGRVGSAQTSRRLQQNNRQLLESFYPGAMRTDEDGWKVNVRLRFVHGRVRNLLKKSEEWNHDAWGLPISAAHLGYAIAVFGHRTMECSEQLGAIYSEEEKDSINKLWRYVGYVMGIPESILFTSRDEAQRILKISRMVEPDPNEDSSVVAKAFIQEITDLSTGLTDPKAKTRFMKWAYGMSRALIGDTLADQLKFPSHTPPGALTLFRIKQHAHHFFRGTPFLRSENFANLLHLSMYEAEGISYKLPTAAKNADSAPW